MPGMENSKEKTITNPKVNPSSPESWLTNNDNAATSKPLINAAATQIVKLADTVLINFFIIKSALNFKV